MTHPGRTIAAFLGATLSSSSAALALDTGHTNASAGSIIAREIGLHIESLQYRIQRNPIRERTRPNAKREDARPETRSSLPPYLPTFLPAYLPTRHPQFGSTTVSTT